MKYNYIGLCFAGLSILTNSCIENLLPVRGNGISETEIRRTGTFYKLENSCSIDIVYKVADTIGVTITADENLLEYIVTETNDNTLEIKTRPGNSFLDFKIKPLITITSPKLTISSISGSGTFISDEMSGEAVTIRMSGSGAISVDRILCSEITVLLSGSGNINVRNLQTTDSDIYLSGSGNISLKGEAENCHFKISGNGDIFSENFLLNSASVLISGSGNLFSTVEQELSAIISGSGNIYLSGNPSITKTISGSGRIIRY